MKKTASDTGTFFDGGIYSGEAVRLAVAVFSDRARVRLSAVKDGFLAEVTGYAGAAGDFANEVLNQQCRLDLEKNGARIAGMISTRALLSAAGPEDGRKEKK